MINSRLLKVEIELNNTLRVYENLAITVEGVKEDSQKQNEFNITITNVSREIREAILQDVYATQKSPKKRKIFVYAGRLQSGYSLVFAGDIQNATPSSPPNIDISFKCLTGNDVKFDIVAKSGGVTKSLKDIAESVAKSTAKRLIFEAINKTIGSYTYTGSALKEVQKLAEVGKVNAYIEDDKLIVKEKSKALKNTAFLVSYKSGLLKAEPTEKGVKVKIYFNPNINVGSEIILESDLNKPLNGSWIVNKIAYNLQNRDSSFFMELEAIKGA